MQTFAPPKRRDEYLKGAPPAVASVYSFDTSWIVSFTAPEWTPAYAQDWADQGEYGKVMYMEIGKWDHTSPGGVLITGDTDECGLEDAVESGRAQRIHWRSLPATAKAAVKSLLREGEE